MWAGSAAAAPEDVSEEGVRRGSFLNNNLGYSLDRVGQFSEAEG